MSKLSYVASVCEINKRVEENDDKTLTSGVENYDGTKKIMMRDLRREKKNITKNM